MRMTGNALLQRAIGAVTNDGNGPCIPVWYLKDKATATNIANHLLGVLRLGNDRRPDYALHMSDNRTYFKLHIYVVTADLQPVQPTSQEVVAIVRLLNQTLKVEHMVDAA